MVTALMFISCDLPGKLYFLKKKGGGTAVYADLCTLSEPEESFIKRLSLISLPWNMGEPLWMPRIGSIWRKDAA